MRGATAKWNNVGYVNPVSAVPPWFSRLPGLPDCRRARNAAGSMASTLRVTRCLISRCVTFTHAVAAVPVLRRARLLLCLTRSNFFFYVLRPSLPLHAKHILSVIALLHTLT